MDETLRRLEQKTAQLRAVGQIGAALAAAWKLEDTLDVITRVTSQVMNVDSCSIYLQAEGSDRLVLQATTGLAKEAIGRASLARGEGLTGWAVTHAQPVAMADALNDPRFKLLPETHEEGLRSLMAVPLSVQGRIIGAMNLQTAGTLEKAALYDCMQQQNQELSTLAKVSQAVTSPLYLDEMLGVVSESAAQVMGAKATSLRLLDEATGQLVLRAAHNISATAYSFSSVVVGRSIAGRAAASGQPIIVPNVQTDERYVNRALAEREGWVSLLCVPLVVREMHHRVKNNLQTITMLLHLQMSAARDLRAEDVLAETINCILSIAAVHETLSEQGLRVVDVNNVLERVTRSIGETMLTAGQGIEIIVTGDRLVLPSREATSLSLVTNELVQNAVEPAFAGRESGRVLVQLQIGPGESAVIVEDDGVGNLRAQAPARGLGLQIVEALVRDDLKGRFELHASPSGMRATIRFPNLPASGANL
jgi:two-component system, sensor histidine kinase PdtaS